MPARIPTAFEMLESQEFYFRVATNKWGEKKLKKLKVRCPEDDNTSFCFQNLKY